MTELDRIERLTAHRPYPPPGTPWTSTQTWHDLIFMHWPLPADVVRPALPRELPLDTFDGTAWIGVVPFWIDDLRPRGLPPVPYLSVSPELWAEQTAKLNVPYALTNTIILVLSSFTCQFGVFAAERLQARRTGKLFDVRRWGVVEWMYLTFAMGAVFVVSVVAHVQERVFLAPAAEHVEVAITERQPKAHHFFTQRIRNQPGVKFAIAQVIRAMQEEPPFGQFVDEFPESGC